MVRGICLVNGKLERAEIEQGSGMEGDIGLTFTNERGDKTTGEFISTHRVRADKWNLSGTVTGDRIQWDNGTAWSR